MSTDVVLNVEHLNTLRSALEAGQFRKCNGVPFCANGGVCLVGAAATLSGHSVLYPDNHALNDAYALAREWLGLETSNRLFAANDAFPEHLGWEPVLEFLTEDMMTAPIATYMTRLREAQREHRD